MNRPKKLALHLALLAALPVVGAGFGIREYLAREHPAQLAPATPEVLAQAARPPFDPSLPTVVVLLGADITEITDAVGPYEMFARVGGFNVLTAAPERRPTLFTGGLEVLPHHSLAEVDALLEGGAPAIVVVPNIPNIAEEQNAPLVSWIRTQAEAGSLMHSWCKGAMALAEAGLLDGELATAHWGDLPTLERRHPEVHWVRGVRWVEHGQFVISAGITSGIDASLRVITRVRGEETARRVARELRYPDFHFAIDPTATQYVLGPADTIVVADAAFGRFDRERLGVALYRGVGELDLSNVYDAHAYTMAADVESIGAARVVETAHGLTLLPAIVLADASSAERVSELDRIAIPGPDARRDAAAIAARVSSVATDVPTQYLHADEPERFGLEPVLEDLARTSDVATATFALRRMEYRASDVSLEGDTVRAELVSVPFVLAALGWLVAAAGRALVRRLRRGRTGDRLRQGTTPMTPYVPVVR